MNILRIGYLDCLGQLTVVGDISKEDFSKRFEFIKYHSDSYHPYVITDEADKIVAAGTLLIEKKFIRNLGTCGHIEDIVVDFRQRGKNLGKILLQALKELAIELGCYKVILDCEEGKVQFYEKCGFKEKGRQMAFYK
jgi:glucosamine-phosphate N-acetyltransferase